MSRCRAIILVLAAGGTNIAARPTFATANADALEKSFRKLSSVAKLLLVLDHLEPAHIGLQHVRHRDRTALLLVILHHGDQRAAYRSTGAVQRVHEARLAVRSARARIHPPRLEITAHRAARNLAVSAAVALPG